MGRGQRSAPGQAPASPLRQAGRLAFGPDDSPTYLDLDNNRLTKWNVESGESRGTVGEAGFLTGSPILSFNGNLVVGVETGNRSLRIANLTNGGTKSWMPPTLPPNGIQVTALAIAPSGQQVLIGCQDGTIRLWEGGPEKQGKLAAKELHTSRKKKSPVKGLAFSPMAVGPSP